MVELKRSLRFACVLAVTAMVAGCGPGTEEGEVAPAQDEVLATDAPAEVGTVEQQATYYYWVNTGYGCKGPLINVNYECTRRGYDGGSSSTCGKFGTLLIQCYVRT